MTRTDEEYVRFDPFEGERDVNIRCRTVKIVTVKKDRECFGLDDKSHRHLIPKGSRARSERALADGEWGAYYLCLPCMDSWLKDIDR